MQNNEKNKKIKILPSIIIVLIVMIAGVLLLLFVEGYLTSKANKGNAVIALSTSNNKIFLGGSGKVNAALQYEDGEISEDGEFIFESDNPELLTFEQSNGKYTGEYQVKAKENNNQFNDVKVTVTVSCTNEDNIEPVDMEIIVTDAQLLSIQFYNGLEDNNPTKINVYQGYSIEKINEIQHVSLEIPDYRPSTDYDTEWYDIETGDLISITNQSEFYGCSELNLYARFPLIGQIELIDKLINTHESLSSEGKIYYGEAIDNNIALKLSESKSPVEGWSFSGWVQNINSNQFENILINGKFYSTTKTLYAKWTSDISFEVPLAVGATKSLGIPTKSKITVVYGGKLGELPSIAYTDPTLTSNVEWRTDKYGAGDSINSFILEGCYFGDAQKTFYNSTEISIKFSDKLTNKFEYRTVIYGSKFEDTYPRFIGDNTRGWIQEDGWLIETLGEQPESFISDFTYNLNYAVECNAIWNVIIKYNADYGNIKNVYNDNNDSYTVKYGQTLNLDNPFPQGSWKFAGWYSSEDLSGDAVGRQSTDNDDFVEMVAEKNTLGADGKYYIPLYAKWINSVNLDYGRGYTPSADLPTSLSLVYGKKISLSKDGQWLPSAGQIGLPDGCSSGTDWYADMTFSDVKSIVDEQTTNYPLLIDTLYFKWIGNKYTIILRYFDKTDTEMNMGSIQNVTYNENLAKLASSYKPSTNVPAGNFLGYFYPDTVKGDIQYYDSELNGVRVWDIPEDNVVLYAHFGTEYTITFDFNGGSDGSNSVKAVYGSDMLPAAAPKRTGYTFTGYYDSKTTQTDSNKYYNDNMSSKKTWDKTRNATLYAGWSANPYTVKFDSNGGNTFTPNPNPFIVTFDNAYGNISNPSRNDDKWDDPNNSKTHWTRKYTFDGWFTAKTGGDKVESTTIVKTANNHTLYAHWSYTDSSVTDNPCVAPGTLITLADGSQVPVEKLTGDEILLVWNLYTGSFDVAPMLFINYGVASEEDDITLYFSDGTTLELVGVHGIWDVGLNMYVTIDGTNAKEYIGHSFYKQYLDNSGVQKHDIVTLINVTIEKKVVESWCPVTAVHLCYYTNGILTVPIDDYIDGLLNIFEINPETMKVDEAQMAADIEKYGLFTYEDFAEYIPEEVFYAFNGQYLKVAMGKGLLSWDDIYALIDRYQDFWLQ